MGSGGEFDRGGFDGSERDGGQGDGRESDGGQGEGRQRDGGGGDVDDELRMRDLLRRAPRWARALLIAWVVFVVTGFALLTAALVARHH